MASLVRPGMASTALRRRWAVLRRLAMTSRKGYRRTGVGSAQWAVQTDSLRLLVAAFGDPGHAFPAIALARALGRRGHEVLVETWERWREAVEGEGLAFTAAQEYTVYPAAGPGHAGRADGRGGGAGAGPLDGGVRAGCGGQRHPHAGAGAGGGGGRGAARDADPARLSGAASRGCRSSRSGCGRRGRRSGGSAWRAPVPAAGDGAAAGAGRAERDAGAARAGADRAVPRRDQRAAGAGGDVPAARVSAASGRRTCG